MQSFITLFFPPQGGSGYYLPCIIEFIVVVDVTFKYTIFGRNKIVYSNFFTMTTKFPLCSSTKLKCNKEHRKC